MKYYSMNEFNDDVEILSGQINRKNYSGIYPIPRGGIPLAMSLSQALNLRLLESIQPRALVVDDLIDSGHTIAPFQADGFDVAVIHLSPNNKAEVPTYFAKHKDPKARKEFMDLIK